MQQNNTPVFVCLYYDEKVLVFDDHQDYTNGKYLLDYGTNVGKQFAAKNKISADDYDCDYKQKFSLLQEKITLPEPTSAEKISKFGEPNPDKTVKKIKTDKKNEPKDETDKQDIKQVQSGEGVNPEAKAAGEGEKSLTDESDDAGQNGKPKSGGKENSKKTKKTVNKQKSKKTKTKNGDNKEKEKKQKPNAKLHFENIKDEETTVDETMDRLIKTDFIYEPIKISEFNLYNRQASEMLVDMIGKTFGRYNIEPTDDIASASDCPIKLLFKIVKYRPGEYNMIKNVSAKITIACTILGERYGVSRQFVRTYDCFATENYPSEVLRLKEIINSILIDLKINLAKIVIANGGGHSTDQTDDAAAKLE